MTQAKQATLYRMVLPDQECPFGVEAKAMLEHAGFTIKERILDTREAVDSFEAEHDVATTPRIFIEGTRIGGADQLKRHLANT